MTMPQDMAGDPRQIVAEFQRQLRESEERYALAMRAINEGFYEWDVATSEMTYSPRVCDLVGLAPEELRTMADWTDRIHPADMPEFKMAILAHFKGETEWLEAEYRYRHADGTWHWARQHGIGLRNEAGRVYRVVGSTGDITAQKAAEEALRESLEQQTATAEVLGLINSSPGDLAPVFDAMLEKATRLCDAEFGTLWTYDGERLHAAGLHGVPAPFAKFLRQPIEPADSAVYAAIVQGEGFVQVDDLSTSDAYRKGDPLRRATVDLGNARTGLAVALRKDASLLGIFAVYRCDICPFTDKQIALLQNFAAQAVIAMENARLITETREALDQQTATAEVLGVINASPGDLAPVFDAMLERAIKLCGAAHGTLRLYDGELFNLVAVHGDPRGVEAAHRLGPIKPISGVPTFEPFVRGERVVHIADTHELEMYRSPLGRERFDAGGVRTWLGVALHKDAHLLGTITVYRQEVRPFTDKQIALLQSFAAQAVIAIENTRLITETREALEQQTATAEVLGVINASPGDLAPVFDAILDKAMELCGAAFGELHTFDGEHYQVAAMRGVPAAHAEFRKRGPTDASSGTISARVLDGENLVHVADLKAGEPYRTGDPQRRSLVDQGGARTALAVALRKEGILLGLLMIYRQEVRPFSEKQIVLLQNFAAQAVVAMENARLLDETREALEQQTAMAEVLRVISSSPTDLQPTFNAIAESAIRICGAVSGGVFRFDGTQIEVGTFFAPTQAERDAVRSVFPIAPGRGSTTARAILTREEAHILDPAADPEFEHASLHQFGTSLSIPMLKNGEPLGAITVTHNKVEAFSDKQIELLKTFADQAVIAIENVRLFNELNERTKDLEESLEQQQAMAEVLQVINSSPGELQPVFDAMLANAVRLCDCVIGGMFLYEDGGFRSVAMLNVTPEFAEIWRRAVMRLAPTTALARLARTKEVIQIDDLLEYEGYTKREALHVATVEVFGARTVVAVPMLKEAELLGAIVVFRREPRSFTEKQLVLVSNFASQAVIAIDNARLLNEIRQRQAELRVTFDNMGDGVAMFDADMRLAAWNLNFQKILDLPEDFVAERPSYTEFARYLAERGEFGADADIEAEVERLLRVAGTSGSLERARPDGRVVEVRYNSVPGGGFVVIYGDITERKRAEAEIGAARDAAEAAYRHLKEAQANLVVAQKMAALGQLTAGIAHEIKNPLNFINNFAGLSGELLEELKETAAPALAILDDDKQAEVDETIEMLTGNLAKIVEHGQRADGIVKSMLEHSRGSSGDRRSVNLNSLIDEALNLAYHGARAQDQTFNIALERDFVTGLAAIELVPQDITRVLLNLFSNGFYAANTRRKQTDGEDFLPTLTVATRDLGNAIEIRVRDNGTGIAPEHRDSLFQPFFTTKPTGEGTGLGLSISYDIVVQQHGGTIEVATERGSFTEFTVRLPRAYRPAAAEAAS